VLLAAERDRSVGPRPRLGTAAATRAGVIVFLGTRPYDRQYHKVQFAFRTGSNSLRMNILFLYLFRVLLGSLSRCSAWRSIRG
ncbi:MAG: hypothetical protein ACKPKO_36135, partial [Candidatus Fonsibacter sp.]